MIKSNNFLSSTRIRRRSSLEYNAAITVTHWAGRYHSYTSNNNSHSVTYTANLIPRKRSNTSLRRNLNSNFYHI